MKALRFISPFFAAFFAAILVSCNRAPYEPLPEPSEVRKVLLMYGNGYNNLSSDIYDDMAELCTTLPDGRVGRFYKVLIFSHLTRPVGITRDDNDYTTPCAPVLIDAYKDEFGRVIADTVKVFPEDMITASADAVAEVLNFVHEHYPAKEYGMIISSHGTGWLPKGYYDTGDDEEWDFFSAFSADGTHHDFVLPESSYAHPLDGPLVKSMMCQAYRNEAGRIATHEVEIRDLAAAIPFRLKYLVLDMCLMGGIEVAYEFSSKVGLLAFSPSEVLAKGFRYDTAVERLLFSDKPDVEGFCYDYFHRYADSGNYASVSLIDCTRLENLASVCSYLFEKYRAEMSYVNPRNIQGYFRGSKHWFYDLEDILVQSGISYEDRQSLKNALKECVLYNEATETLFGFHVYTHCGFSMYLPSNGSSYLDGFYKELRWNKATSLVK